MFDLSLFRSIWVRSGDMVEFLDFRNQIVRAVVVIAYDGKLEIMCAEVTPPDAYIGRPCTFMLESKHVEKIWLVKPAIEVVPQETDNRLYHGERVMFSGARDGVIVCALKGFAIAQPNDTEPGKDMLHCMASTFKGVAQRSKALQSQ